ncbi:uncharacterized protein LOC127795693 isoform X2 [Diospyros lotus]|uniref:uncharacterized protein LOC127795693 isoform X2 n=1 Tax=Diospyros lotus TaxID=55363 RepID=UPI0022560AED|nr:uncharacterized protein LOC127795693 isoform X2 [Diospyros lotus]
MCEMDAGEERKADLYAVLGLKKECSAAELRNAYKKLALRWHPDRCSASGSSKHVEEAKKKFQAIQEAYSVLSDADKRFLYDVGVYDCNDDENGMGDFLNEMAAMMCQNKPNGNGEDSFEELQELFEEMIQSDIESFGSTSQTATPPSCSSSLYASCGESSSATNKRSCSEMNSGKEKTESSSGFHAGFEGFCFGTGRTSAKPEEGERRRRGRNARGCRR